MSPLRGQEPERETPQLSYNPHRPRPEALLHRPPPRGRRTRKSASWMIGQQHKTNKDGAQWRRGVVRGWGSAAVLLLELGAGAWGSTAKIHRAGEIVENLLNFNIQNY